MISTVARNFRCQGWRWILAASIALASCGSDSVESLLASGKSHAAKREHQAAIIQFKTALQKDPASSEARYLLGQALLDASDPAAASLELSRALDQNADVSKVVPALARAYVLSGQYKKATTLYGDMNLPDARAQASLKATLATAWAAQGDKTKTLAAADASIKAVPDFPPALVLQARIEAGQGKFDNAKVLVERALKQDENLYEAWHLKGEFLTFVDKDSKAAAEAYRKALSIEPAFMAAHMSLVSDRIRARDVDGVQAAVDQLRKVLPKHPQTAYLDAQLAFWKRDFKKAREIVQALLRALPDNPDVLQMAGAVEAQLGALVLAESHFAKALQINPRLYLSRRNLGQVYLQLGQPSKTLDTLQPLLTAGTQDATVHALAGSAYLAVGNAAMAEQAFRQAVSLKPDHTRVRTALALTHLARGDAETAFDDLQTIAGESGKDTFADQAIISARLSRREYDAALAAANALLVKDGGKAATLEQRGRIQRLRKDYTAARSDFEQALKVDPSLFSATTSLAALDVLEKKPDQARKRLEVSLQAEPKNYYARLALADIRLREGASLEEVTRLLADGTQLSPTEPELRLALIELLLNKRQYKDALSVAQDANAALPNDSRVLDALGRAQAEAGDIEQAISTFRRVADAKQGSAAPHLRLAQIYAATNRKAAAETALRKALEVEPNSELAQQAMAGLMLSSNRMDEAIAFARKLQEKKPRAASGYVFEATVLIRQKKLDQALAAYQRGLAVKSHEPELALQYYLTLQRNGRRAEGDRFGAAWTKANPDDLVFDYQLAVTALQRNDLEQAETRLLRIVQLRPNYAVALNNLAWVLASRGKPGGAAFAQRALALVPDKPEFLDTLALALMVDKQPAKALEVQKRVVELRPTEPAYRLSLARIALEAGDKTLARAELDRLKALGASYPQQAEVAALAQKL